MLYEWIIIGSGAGGLTAAHQVTKEFSEGVMLLEAGGVPSSKNLPENLRGGGLRFAFGSPLLRIGEARCLGGGPAINSRLYHPLPGAEYEDARRWIEENLLETDPPSRTPLEDQLFKNLTPEMNPLTPKRFANLPEKLLLPSIGRGLLVRPNEPVKKITRKGAHWQVWTPQGEYRTKKIALTAGPLGSQGLLPPSLRRIFYHPQFRLLADFPDLPKASTQIPCFQWETDLACYGFSAHTESDLCTFGSSTPENLPEIRKRSNTLYAFYASPKLPFRFWAWRGKPLWAPYSQEARRLTHRSLEELEAFLRSAGARDILFSGKDAQWNGPIPEFRKLDLTTVHLMGGVGPKTAAKLARDHLHVLDASLFDGPLYKNPQGGILTITFTRLSGIFAPGI